MKISRKPNTFQYRILQNINNEYRKEYKHTIPIRKSTKILIKHFKIAAKRLLRGSTVYAKIASRWKMVKILWGNLIWNHPEKLNRDSGGWKGGKYRRYYFQRRFQRAELRKRFSTTWYFYIYPSFMRFPNRIIHFHNTYYIIWSYIIGLLCMAGKAYNLKRIMRTVNKFRANKIYEDVRFFYTDTLCTVVILQNCM